MSQHVPVCVVQTLRPVRISTESIIDYLWRKPTCEEAANGETSRQSVNLRERESRVSILAPPMTSSVVLERCWDGSFLVSTLLHHRLVTDNSGDSVRVLLDEIHI